jgi:hypothetical protein
MFLERPHPSLVYVWSPTPDPDKRPALGDALRKQGRRKLELRWVRPRLEDGLAVEGGDVHQAVAYAVGLRAHAGEAIGERALRKLGVSVERLRPRTLARSLPPPDPANVEEPGA